MHWYFVIKWSSQKNKLIIECTPWHFKGIFDYLVQKYIQFKITVVYRYPTSLVYTYRNIGSTILHCYILTETYHTGLHLQTNGQYLTALNFTYRNIVSIAIHWVWLQKYSLYLITLGYIWRWIVSMLLY